MTGQPSMLELKQKEYNITAIREERAPPLHSSLPPLFPIWSDEDL